MATRELPQHYFSFICFEAICTARSFVRGYCVPRVVARVSGAHRFPFVICHPSTASRHGWRVVS